jgi:hypothetical protein
MISESTEPGKCMQAKRKRELTGTRVHAAARQQNVHEWSWPRDVNSSALSTRHASSRQGTKW